MPIEVTFGIPPLSMFGPANHKQRLDTMGVVWSDPDVFLSRHLSLEGDCGLDHTHLPGSYEGWLRKCTIAPQIRAYRKFFGRPVLRAFLTYANWSNGFRGLIGEGPFENATDGLTYGLQVKHCW